MPTITNAPYTLRALRTSEQDLLVQATLGNVNWSGPRFTVEQVMQAPALVHYFAPWPGTGDFGVVAEDGNGAPVGVVWLRFFPATDPGYGFVDEAIPELSVWVSEAQRGLGLGTCLMTEILDQARTKELPEISLSVETGNPARSLYERVGFTPAGSDFDAGTLILHL